MNKSENKENLNESVSKKLVSIIVFTYNSSKFVIETLESAKIQTYNNIELIISDDCSKDNTVEICRTWLEENKDHFVRTELITVSKNTGIPANCNRGVKASNGEWIKLIAGDDILWNDAIMKMMYYLGNRKHIKVLQTNIQFFNENIDNLMNIVLPLSQNKNIFDWKSSLQLKRLLNRNFIAAPGVFLKKSLIEELGFFDEEFRIMEDLPMWFKILNSGNKFYYLDEYTVNYRKHINSMTNASEECGLAPYSTNYIKIHLRVLEKYRKLSMKNKNLYKRAQLKFRYYLFISKLRLKENFFITLINKIVYKYL